VVSEPEASDIRGTSRRSHGFGKSTMGNLELPECLRQATTHMQKATAGKGTSGTEETQIVDRGLPDAPTHTKSSCDMEDAGQHSRPLSRSRLPVEGTSRKVSRSVMRTTTGKEMQAVA
jgi:hypothetical protein